MAYIPQHHLKYNLLPRCQKNGREVFAYPSLSAIEAQIADDNERALLTPYGYNSYSEYYQYVDQLIAKYGVERNTFNQLGKQLLELKSAIDQMNRKEYWSVLQYVGESTDSTFGLTCQQHYYWPCMPESPSYGGVIDDEEFTSYRHTTNPEKWIIKEDFSGMARCVFLQYNLKMQ